MTKNQDLNRWKQIQASMALEGHFISDELLESTAKEYADDGLDAEMDRAILLAKSTGRPLLEVLKELQAREEL